jgi:hypothetical protein
MNDNEKEVKVEPIDEEKDFFKDVLDDPEAEDEELDVKPDPEGETEEQKKERSQKNIDAEAKRKRLEAEAKAQKALEEKKAQEEAEAKKQKETEDKQKEAKEKQIGTLGKQLDDFKKDFPDVDLKELDNDKSFKRFIDGKLLGKKHFTDLYKEYLDIRSELSGKPKEEVEANYKKKAEASSGTSTPKSETNPNDVFSEEEYNKMIAKLPYMSDADAKKVMAKFERSTKYYQK